MSCSCEATLAEFGKRLDRYAAAAVEHAKDTKQVKDDNLKLNQHVGELAAHIEERDELMDALKDLHARMQAIAILQGSSLGV